MPYYEVSRRVVEDLVYVRVVSDDGVSTRNLTEKEQRAVAVALCCIKDTIEKDAKYEESTDHDVELKPRKERDFNCPQVHKHSPWEIPKDGCWCARCQIARGLRKEKGLPMENPPQHAVGEVPKPGCSCSNCENFRALARLMEIKY